MTCFLILLNIETTLCSLALETRLARRRVFQRCICGPAFVSKAGMGNEELNSSPGNSCWEKERLKFGARGGICLLKREPTVQTTSQTALKERLELCTEAHLLPSPLVSGDHLGPERVTGPLVPLPNVVTLSLLYLLFSLNLAPHWFVEGGDSAWLGSMLTGVPQSPPLL